VHYKAPDLPEDIVDCVDISRWDSSITCYQENESYIIFYGNIKVERMVENNER
jgi:hypothetical protein